MENIFEEAKFGDKFLTKDGRIALFIMHIPYKEECCFLLDNGLKTFIYSNQDSGCNKDTFAPEYDIVSKYQEPIVVSTIVQRIVDEDKLDELAEEWSDWDDNSNETEWSYTHKDICKAYKAGYRKAIEE